MDPPKEENTMTNTKTRRLTAAQRRVVARVTADRCGDRRDVGGDAWRKAFAWTAWELYRV